MRCSLFEVIAPPPTIDSPPPPPPTEDSEKLVEPAAGSREKEMPTRGVNTSLKTKLSSRFAGFMSKSKQAASTPSECVGVM